MLTLWPRRKRASFNVEKVVCHAKFKVLVDDYTKQAQCEEIPLFIRRVTDYRCLFQTGASCCSCLGSQDNIKRQANLIVQEHFSVNSKHQINVSYYLTQMVLNNWQQGKLTTDLFDDVCTQVMIDFKTGAFDRLTKSKEFLGLLSQHPLLISEITDGRLA